MTLKKLAESSQAGWGNAPKLSRRFPIRWRWTLMVGLVVLVSVVIQFYIFLDNEKTAWLKSHLAHEKVLVERLGDDLTGPMLSNNPEIEIIVNSFLSNVPDAAGVYLHYNGDEDISFGIIDIQNTDIHEQLHSLIAKGERTDIKDREWYIHRIEHHGTPIGMLVVQFKFDSWHEQKRNLYKRLLLSILIALTISSFLVNWLIGKMSKPIEALSCAAKKVANGNYSVRLSHNGNDEIGDAIDEFNILVAELEHKEKIRSVFGRYLNPKLISEVYKNADIETLSQRREVTVLFADMIAFTSFSESASGDRIVSSLNRHFGVFHRIIKYFGGHVDKFMGDAVMAVFNHPHKDPEQSTTAALAGLAIQIACKELAECDDKGKPILFRIAVNRGKVIVGNIGSAERSEYTVVGRPVNVASRIVGLGNGEQVIMKRSTYERLDKSMFQFNSIGQHKIKGVSEKMHCGYIVLNNEELKQSITDALHYAFDISREV